MSGGGSGNTTTTTKAELPGWLANASQDNLNRAVGVVNNTGFTPYTDPRIAGQTPDQLAAATAIRHMQGRTGAALGSLGDASAGLGTYQAPDVNAWKLSDSDLTGYMNPFTGEVETNALRALEGTRQDSQNQIGDAFQSSKAFGGSRQALQSAVTDAQFGQRAGDLSAQLRQANFNQAQAAATGDISRDLQAQLANQQAGLASTGLDLSAYKQAADIYGQRQAADVRDIGLLDASGGQQQQMQQGQLDMNYQNWLEGQNFSKDQIAWLQQMLGSTPGSGTTTVNTGGGSKASPAMGALGGAASGAALGTSISPGYGTAIGAVAGALYGGLSSR
jgi:predicted XRE-type DNA-binding protein